MGAQTAAVQGSGWGWLGWNKATNSLEIATTPNQDPLKPSTGLIPLLGIDGECPNARSSVDIVFIFCSA